MTKKILAVLLSVALVVSLLPATIFATENGCPMDHDAHDGFNGHSVAHWVAHGGKESELIVVSTIEAACGQDGCTIYECPACHERFADSIVRAPQEHVKGEVVIAAKEPTCVEGNVATYKCANEGCGKSFMDPDEIAQTGANAEGKIPATDNHTYEDAYCNQEEHTCTVCGKTDKFTTYENHEYDYDRPYVEGQQGGYKVLKAPTESEKGLIEFFCIHDGCTWSKEVTINELAHEHKMKHNAKETTGTGCVTTTVAAHYECEKCGKLYEDQAGTTETFIEDLTSTTDHNWNDQIHYVAPTCTTPGFSCYFCLTCGASKGVTPETENEKMTVHPSLDHTWFECSEHGREWDPEEECKECADAKLSEQYAMTPATCNVNGAHTWNCGREGCDYVKSEAIVAKGHEVVTVVVPATCNQVAYTFEYCKSTNCDQGTGALEVLGEYTKDGKTFDLSVKVENGKVFDTEGEVKFIGLVSMGTEKDANNHKWKIEEVNLPTCTMPGNHVEYCADCAKHVTLIDDATGHTYDMEHEDNVAADCTTNAYIYCEVCEDLIEQANTKLPHKYDDTENKDVNAPQCDGTQGYTKYGCSAGDCGTMGFGSTTNGKDALTTFVPMKEYATLEEAQAEHTATLTDKNEFRAPTCDLYGLWEYTCADCKADGRPETVLVVMDGTGLGHSQPPVVYTEATCTQYKGHPAYTCTNPYCTDPNRPEKIEQAALGHDMTEVPYKAPTCLEAGNEAYWTCANKCCEGKFYKDEDGSAEWNPGDPEADPAVLPEYYISAVPHNWTETEEFDDCTAPGFKHYICDQGCCDPEICDNDELCGEYVDFYVEKVHHIKGNAVITPATCVKDGSKDYYCTVDGCGAKLDEYSETLEAEGHKNAAGDLLENNCQNKVEDRVCVRCNEALAANSEHADYCDDECKADLKLNATTNKWEVKNEHKKTPVEVKAGCESYGWKMESCRNEGCTEHEVIEIVNPLGHTSYWGEQYYFGKEAEEVINENVIDEYLDYNDFDEEAGESYTAPTYEALGSVTFLCAKCGDLLTRDVIRTGVDFTMDIINAVDPEAEYANDGGIVAITITMNAYQTEIGAFQFSVPYGGMSMNYLGYTYHLGETFNKAAVSNHVDDIAMKDEDDDDDDGIYNENYFFLEDYNAEITVVAYIDNKDASSFELTGSVDVVTLYFQLESEYAAGYWDVIKSYNVYEGFAFVSDIVVADADNEKINEVGDDAVEFEFGYLGDINGDEICDVIDVVECYKLWTAGQYDVAADVNNDGAIDDVDLGLIYQRAQKVVTDLDVIAQNLWTIA